MIYIVTQNKLTKDYTSHCCNGDGCKVPPHLGGYTNDVYIASSDESYKELIQFLEGQKKQFNKKGWIR